MLSQLLWASETHIQDASWLQPCYANLGAGPESPLKWTLPENEQHLSGTSKYKIHLSCLVASVTLHDAY